MGSKNKQKSKKQPAKKISSNPNPSNSLMSSESSQDTSVPSSDRTEKTVCASTRGLEKWGV